MAALHRLNASADWLGWFWPIVSGVVALVAVGYIVWLATSLLTPSPITLQEVATKSRFNTLQELVAADPTAYLGLWGRDIPSFVKLRDREFEILAKLDAKIRSSSNSQELKSLTAARPLQLKVVEVCGLVSARLLAVAGFYDLARRFSDAKIRMFVAAVFVVIGIVGFVATTPSDAKATTPNDGRATTPNDGKATTPSDDKHQAADQMAVPALVSLTSKGATEIEPVLGIGCTNPIQAVLLAGDAKGPWRLMITDDRCRNGTLTVWKEQAVVLEVFPSPGK
ncbi:hypothetical protein [Mycobacterium sp. 1245805.9]|uniref:hypothetical protein n=1 Tax=Mycobacterium sp. 1245805.9 TaxID=1856862 RepID=UPI0012E9A006|nr:hypothetical protein [Mycobacterium sp. 1245805.9]